MTDIAEAVVAKKEVAPSRGRMSEVTLAHNRAEEPRLISAWQTEGCSQSLQTLIDRYKPMIGSQIQKILAGRSVSISHRQDLEQEANLAFIQAVSSFKESLSVPLSAYATKRVRNTLLEYTLHYRHSYRIGKSSAERKAYYAALAMRADHIRKGKSALLSEEDISSIKMQTGASEKATRRAVESIYSSRTSIEDAPDIVGPDAEDAAEQDIAQGSAMDILAPFIATLDERQTALLECYLRDEKVQTQELAARFDVTKERIGQIHRDMLEDMRIFLKKHGVAAQDVL